jgi:heat shock protein beta
MSWAHFNAEGDVEFKAILYVPATAPPNFYDNYYTMTPDVKLYVRRVFISDDFEDLLPRYLIFLKVCRRQSARMGGWA